MTAVGHAPGEAAARPAPVDQVSGVRSLLRDGFNQLWRDDPVLAATLDSDLRYQQHTLAMIASASVADPAVLVAQATPLSNVTAEGYPGARYHSGARWLDEVERLAIERACRLFGARYANVQPHSCSSANLAVLAALLAPGGTLLALHLDAGGHLTHGAAASVTSRLYRAEHYGVGSDGIIDLDDVASIAARTRPQVIIAGASAYPRSIDFAGFRAIADEVGAFLVADISHIAGLVAAGEHPSPVAHAHVTTTSTYKQLAGPRGGLILTGDAGDRPGPDGRTALADLLQRAVFPRTQGTPSPGAIAAKAMAFELAARPAFADLARRIRADARALADGLRARGHRLVTDGTDNHLVVLDLRGTGLTGVAAERALEAQGILVNRNRVPGDTAAPLVTSGLRLGTNILAQRGMGPAQMAECAVMVDELLSATPPSTSSGSPGGEPDPTVAARVTAKVAELCRRFPLPMMAAAAGAAPMTPPPVCPR